MVGVAVRVANADRSAAVVMVLPCASAKVASGCSRLNDLRSGRSQSALARRDLSTKLPAACPAFQNVSNSLREFGYWIVTAVATALCLLVAPNGSSVHTHFVHHVRSDATNGR